VKAIEQRVDPPRIQSIRPHRPYKSPSPGRGFPPPPLSLPTTVASYGKQCKRKERQAFHDWIDVRLAVGLDASDQAPKVESKTIVRDAPSTPGKGGGYRITKLSRIISEGLTTRQKTLE
jgi:hypothetical protein